MSKFKFSLSTLLFIFSLFLLSHVFALPRGSYRQTCYACVVQGDNLTCNCMTENQMQQMTTLPGFWGCNDIRNVNGQLVCLSRTEYQLPAGSYRETCQNCSIQGNNLTCYCRTRQGFWNHSIIYYFRDCASPIQNINGNLMCRFKTWHLPPGSYRHTCFNCRYDGFNLACQCLRADHTVKYTVLEGAHVCINILNADGNLRCW